MCLARLLTAVSETRPEAIALANPIRLDRELAKLPGNKIRVRDFADKAGNSVGAMSDVGSKGAATKRLRTLEAVNLVHSADPELALSIGVESTVPYHPPHTRSNYRGMPLKLRCFSQLNNCYNYMPAGR